MGHAVPRDSWDHLFINGIYWGPYLLSERVDQSFMQILDRPQPAPINGYAHYDVMTASDAFGEIVGWGGDYEAISGSAADFLNLIQKCETLATANTATKATLYTEITSRLDMNNYIDYLIANT